VSHQPIITDRFNQSKNINYTVSHISTDDEDDDDDDQDDNESVLHTRL
jgi:hypothetical protein